MNNNQAAEITLKHCDEFVLDWALIGNQAKIITNHWRYQVCEMMIYIWFLYNCVFLCSLTIHATFCCGKIWFGKHDDCTCYSNIMSWNLFISVCSVFSSVIMNYIVCRLKPRSSTITNKQIGSSAGYDWGWLHIKLLCIFVKLYKLKMYESATVCLQFI